FALRRRTDDHALARAERDGLLSPPFAQAGGALPELLEIEPLHVKAARSVQLTDVVMQRLDPQHAERGPSQLRPRAFHCVLAQPSTIAPPAPVLEARRAHGLCRGSHALTRGHTATPCCSVALNALRPAASSTSIRTRSPGCRKAVTV